MNSFRFWYTKIDHIIQSLILLDDHVKKSYQETLKLKSDMQYLFNIIQEIELKLLTGEWSDREAEIYSLACGCLNLYGITKPQEDNDDSSQIEIHQGPA